jgi:hypothetical protein
VQHFADFAHGRDDQCPAMRKPMPLQLCTAGCGRSAASRRQRWSMSQQELEGSDVQRSVCGRESAGEHVVVLIRVSSSTGLVR